MPRMERAGRTAAIGSGGLRQCKLEEGCQARANAPTDMRRRVRRLRLNRQGRHPTGPRPRSQKRDGSVATDRNAGRAIAPARTAMLIPNGLGIRMNRPWLAPNKHQTGSTTV